MAATEAVQDVSDDAKKKEGMSPEKKEKLLSVLVPVLSILLALVVGGIVILCLGENPFEAYALLFTGSLGSWQKFATSLTSACPLIFTSLAATFAYKCGVFNLGGEGQFIMGAVASFAVVYLTGIEGIPGIILALATGAVVGGLWAAIPGLLKIWRGLNEMITSIMLNYIATLFMGYIYTSVFRDGGNPQTPSVDDSVKLYKFEDFRIHIGVIIAIVVALVVAYVLNKTSFGFKIRAVGENPTAAKVNGYPVKKLIMAAFIISGAIAGLGGSVELYGKQYRLLSGFGDGVGFDGVAIALIAQLNPIGALIVSIFFGILTTGAITMQVGLGVPTAIVDIIRALIIIFSVAGMAIVKLPKIKQLLAQSKSEKKEGQIEKAEANA